MKTLELLLITLLISHYFSYDCANDFNFLKTTQCTNITSCNFYGPSCKEIKTCSGQSSDDCPNIILTDYLKNKCVYGTSCEQTQRECGDYNTKRQPGDVCQNLFSGAASGKRCDFALDGTTCNSYFNECDGLNGGNCASNIPSDYSKKCELASTGEICNKVPRTCLDTFAIGNETACIPRKASVEGKTCVYLNDQCNEKYVKCDDYDGDSDDDCQNITPYDSSKKSLDYSLKCFMKTINNEGDKHCSEGTKTCDDYLLGDFAVEKSEEEKCSYAKATDNTNFRCTYDSTKEKKCYEIERECDYFNRRADDKKSKEECEKIVPSDTNKKCVYENNVCKVENKKCENMMSKTLCEELTLENSHMYCKWIGETGSEKCIENYDACESYAGNDKEICIGIQLNKPNSCILKHDSFCIEGELTCTSAQNEEQCKTARPVDPKKKCIYYDGTCYEDYAKCGDYDSSSTTSCEDIKLHNGKKCVYDTTNSKCKTELKKCSEALDKNECQLLFKLGVTDQEYYRCNWDDTRPTEKCYQELMYCSDYNLTVQTDCQKIKPYDKLGNYIETAYKCDFDSSTPNVKCERILKKCSDAGLSMATCKSISEKLELISDNYCAFIDNACVEHYKTCSAYVPDEDETFNDDKCKKNIPQNYKTYHCEVKSVTAADDSTTKTCEEKKNDCDFYNTDTSNANINYDNSYWGDICLNIGELCQYSTADGTCTQTTTKSCDQIKFTSIKDENLNICKNNLVSANYKVCTLSRDKLGCEEFNKIINTPISLDDLDKDDNNDQDTDADTSEGNKQNDSENNNNNNNNYGGKKFGVSLIYIILSLSLLF